MVTHLVEETQFFLHIYVPGFLHPVFFNQLFLRIVLLRIRRKAVNIMDSTEQDVFGRIIFPHKLLIKIKEFLCVLIVEAVQRYQLHVCFFQDRAEIYGVFYSG